MKATAFSSASPCGALQPARRLFRASLLPGCLISARNDDHKLTFHVVFIFRQPRQGRRQRATEMLLKFLSKLSPKKTLRELSKCDAQA